MRQESKQNNSPLVQSLNQNQLDLSSVSLIRRYVGTPNKCLTLGIVRPNFSLMSKSIGLVWGGSFQEKQCTN